MLSDLEAAASIAAFTLLRKWCVSCKQGKLADPPKESLGCIFYLFILQGHVG